VIARAGGPGPRFPLNSRLPGHRPADWGVFSKWGFGIWHRFYTKKSIHIMDILPDISLSMCAHPRVNQ